MDEHLTEPAADMLETVALSPVDVAVATTAVAKPDTLATAGATASTVAAQYLFQKYRETKSENTLKRHGYDLRLFSDYLLAVGVVPHKRSFATEPDAWTGVTWGLIEGFVAWQIREGFAIASTNARLSTVKCYAGGESGPHRPLGRDVDWRGQRLLPPRRVESG